MSPRWPAAADAHLRIHQLHLLFTGLTDNAERPTKSESDFF